MTVPENRNNGLTTTNGGLCARPALAALKAFIAESKTHDKPSRQFLAWRRGDDLKPSTERSGRGTSRGNLRRRLAALEGPCNDKHSEELAVRQQTSTDMGAKYRRRLEALVARAQADFDAGIHIDLARESKMTNYAHLIAAATREARQLSGGAANG